MPTQEDFPDKWSCESENKDVMVELQVGQEVQATRETQYGTEELIDGLSLSSNDEDGVIILTSDEQLVDAKVSYYDEREDQEAGKSFAVFITDLSIAEFNVTDDGFEYIFPPPSQISREEVPDNDEDFGENYYLTLETVTKPSWIEIPTSSVELWEEKGDAASIQRTAKVEFPTEWGENSVELETNSPKQFVTQFDSQNPNGVMRAKVRFRQDDGTWILKHHGWVGGVGDTSTPNTSKLWVYDFAEFLSGVPTSITFNEMGVGDVFEKLTRRVNDNAAIPIIDAVLMPPETEEEMTITAQNFRDGDVGVPAEVFRADDVDVDLDVNVTSYYSLSDEEFISTSRALRRDRDDTISNVPTNVDENFKAVIIRNDDTLDLGLLNRKSFDRNRATLQDAVDWYERKTESSVRFEPRENGVILVSDIQPSRRRFIQEERIENAQQNLLFHEAIEVIKNNALYEILPRNTLRVNGAKDGGLLGGEATYPTAKATVPALISATEDENGNTYELQEVITSDATSLDVVERQAREELSRLLQQESEGSIQMFGEPRLSPYDRVEAFETCGDFVQYDTEAIIYEAESVKHTKTADDVYKTDIQVSIWANETNIEVESEVKTV